MRVAVVPFDDWTLRGRWWPNAKRRGAPQPAAVFHHSVTNTAGQSDTAQAQTVEEVIYGRRFTSRFSMVAYSWLLASSTLFEGRGRRYRNGANNDTKATGITNGNSISIVLCGNYEDNVAGVPTLKPTRRQAELAAGLLLDLIDAGELVASPELRIVPHNYVHATACPGDHIEGAWLDLVRNLVAAGDNNNQETPTMSTIYRIPAGLGAVDLLEHGATISAIEVGTSDELNGAGILRVPLTINQAEGLRWRWADHGILDESVASAAWTAFAGAIGLANPGLNWVRLSDGDAPPAPDPIELQEVADAVADELANRLTG